MIDVDNIITVMEDYAESLGGDIDATLRSAAETVKTEVAKQMREGDIWTGQFLKNLKVEKINDFEYRVYSDVFYSHLVEFGHREQRFWPLSYPGGQLTRLGEWAMDKLGFVPSGRLNRKGYMIFVNSQGEKITGLEFRMVGKRVFRRGLLSAMRKVPEGVRLEFVTKYGGY